MVNSVTTLTYRFFGIALLLCGHYLTNQTAALSLQKSADPHPGDEEEGGEGFCFVKSP